MKPIFADTAFYLALLSRRDVFHELAVSLSRQLSQIVIVTEFILLELGNTLSRPRERELFVNLVSHLRSDERTRIIGASEELFERGYQLFCNRPDKEWSLTDCVSFVVMEEHGLTDALTADHHFEQAGFNILMK